MKRALQCLDQIDFESVGISNHIGVDKHLVWFSKAKCEPILVHQLSILLRPLPTHFGVGGKMSDDAEMWRAEGGTFFC
jgi:hypothetical protein